MIILWPTKKIQLRKQLGRFIEHNTELIKQADWIIDLGPDGGEKGGKICFEGTPKDLIKKRNNKTAKYLKKHFVKQI